MKDLKSDTEHPTEETNILLHVVVDNVTDGELL